MEKKNILIILGSLIAILSFILIFTGFNKSEEVKYYVVSFDSNGGTFVSAKAVKENDKVVKPEKPTKEGYTFVEWLLEDKVYDFNSVVTSDIVLKAKWEEFTEVEESFVVKFNTDGGTKIEDQTVNKGAKVEKPITPTKEGHVFKEWILNNKAYDFNLVVEKDIELKAVWEKEEQKQDVKSYTVTFDAKGGSSVKSQTVKEGNKVSKPSNPTRSGYTFEGWTLNGNSYNFNTKVTKNITLVASWKKVEEVKPEVKSYTVTFDSKGGSSVKSQTVEEGKAATKPSDPTRSGYTFGGWTLNGSAYDFNTKVTKNITLVANWKEIEKPVVKNYTIKVSMVDSYSPDRILSVYENGSKIGFKSISYTDGTYLCSGSNSTVSVGDITGETRFKVILNDGTEVTATVE